MSATIAILGAGRMGRVIAHDLQDDYPVTVIDKFEEALDNVPDNGNLETLQKDVTAHKDLSAIFDPYQMVINALPGHLGFEILRKCIEAGQNVVDISFFEENPFELHELAQDKEVTAIVDAGVAPGLSNLIAGYYEAQTEISHFSCYVGGMPVTRDWPLSYKAPFSPSDVLQEYVRPSRLIENGRQVERPALSDPEWLDFEETGTLVGFNTDGLRTLLHTLDIPYMKEKTLRYPEHYWFIKALREAGFLEEEPLTGEGASSLDLTARILEPRWSLESQEQEFTLLYIEIEEVSQNNPQKTAVKLYDCPDRSESFSSMGRTTGYTCAAIARYCLAHPYSEPGIIPPERLGQSPEAYRYIKNYLTQKGLHLSVSQTDHSNSISS